MLHVLVGHGEVMHCRAAKEGGAGMGVAHKRSVILDSLYYYY